MDALIIVYPWIKALHIAAVISWMAGMFYLPRLFVYHAERSEVGDALDEVFQVMERKLLRLIMRPAMIVTWAAGIALTVTPGLVDWSQAWFWIKLAAVLAMTATHGWLSKRVRVFAAGGNRLAGRRYRLVNEIPTVLMLIIVIAVVVRPF